MNIKTIEDHEMSNNQEYVQGALKIIVSNENNTISCDFFGKSNEREPAKFIDPVFQDIYEKSKKNNNKIILDFQKLEYMNSSTITPLIKLLDLAKRESAHVSVQYSKNLRWQDLSFSALEIFKTPDERINIIGI